MDDPASLIEELYYIQEDIGEKSNLIKQYPNKASELRRLISNARTESVQFNWKKR